MDEVVNEQEPMEAVSEHPEAEHQEEIHEPKMVPLAALQAERRKRQELEARQQVYQDMMRAKEEQSPQEDEDPNGLVEKHHLKETTAMTKRDILETLYQDMNPDAVQKINKYLGPILEKKPWLASSVESAPNRYARAHEIVNDYLHLVDQKPVARQTGTTDGQRIIQNAQKPRSPAEIGKSARPDGLEYLKSVQGKKEFREYRQKVLQGGI